jgi:hypothetical protein
MSSTELADARRRLAAADVAAVLHHLAMATEALERVHGRLDRPAAQALVRVSKQRIASARMHARKSIEMEVSSGRQD